MIAVPSAVNRQTAAEVFRKLVELRSTRNNDGIAEITELLDDELTGFGTASHEIFKNSSDVVRQLEREVLQTPFGFNYQFHWLKEQALTKDTSVVVAEARITIPLTDRTLIFDPVRMSAVFHVKNAVHRLVHWHTSFPDNSGSDEIFPGSGEPKRYDDITVVFTDFVGFTETASSIPAADLVSELNALFVKFDALANRFGLDKIKTIGDSYMAVSGLCCRHKNPPLQAVKWAKAVLAYLEERNRTSAIRWDIRIGIHTGTVIGGVIGTDKLSFDLWGDTVNVANRMETESVANRINVSSETYARLKDHLDFEHRGTCAVKGKGAIEMYYVK